MSSHQSPHPYLNFCPYLPLREPIEFADWSVGPLSAFAERWTDARFKAQAEAFLRKFVDHEGKPLEHPSLVVRRSGAVDCTRPKDAEISALNLALTFAALEGNPRRTEDTRRSPWSMMTTDNAELHVWPVDVEDGDVTVTSGGIIRTISGATRSPTSS